MEQRDAERLIELASINHGLVEERLEIALALLEHCDRLASSANTAGIVGVGTTRGQETKNPETLRPRGSNLTLMAEKEGFEPSTEAFTPVTP